MATGIRTAPMGFVGHSKDLYQKNVRFSDLASEIRRCGPKMKESLSYPTFGGVGSPVGDRTGRGLVPLVAWRSNRRFAPRYHPAWVSGARRVPDTVSWPWLAYASPHRAGVRWAECACGSGVINRENGVGARWSAETAHRGHGSATGVGSRQKSTEFGLQPRHQWNAKPG